MKNILLLFLIVATQIIADAQTKISVEQPTSESSYTLQQCIDYALKNQILVKNAEMDQKIAKARVGEIRAIGLPQINGAVSLIDNPQLRRLFLQYNPGSPSAAFFTGSGVQLKPGEVVAIPQLFQLKASGDAGATVSQILFDGSYLVGLKAAQTYRELSSKNYDQTKIQVTEAVTKAFYLILINTERIALLNVNLGRLDTLLKQTKAQQAAGFVEKIDVSRIEVSYNNLLTEKQKIDNLQNFSLVLLKYQMGMPLETPLEVKGSIAEVKTDIFQINIQPVEYSKRPEFSLLQTQQKLQNLDLKNNKAGYYPRLSAFATGGLYTGNTGFTQLFTGNWFPYSSVGVNLAVPIFDGFQKSYKIQQSRLNIQKAGNNVLNMKNTIDMQVRQAEITSHNSLQTLEAQKRNMDLATEVARVAKIKYQEGIGSNLEVTTAEASLRESQTNYYNALYDAMVAKIDYQKATGTLLNE